jgi:hypothetical protein
MNAQVISDIELQQRTNDELIHVVRKFRWMGLDDQAKRAQGAACASSSFERQNPLMGLYMAQPRSSASVGPARN